MPQAVILAGGRGTRLAERLHGMPKPLVSVGGIPLLERQIMALKEYGIRRVCILVNYRAEDIATFCRSKNDFGLDISLVDDGEPRGTAGAFLAAMPYLNPDEEDFLVLYGDTLFNVDFGRFLDFHVSHAGAATIFLHPNDHPHDSDLVEMDESYQVRAFHPYPHKEGAEYANLVNAAMYCLRRKGLDRWTHLAAQPPRILDFAKELFPMMLAANQGIYGYMSPEYIRDVGTPKRLDMAEADLVNGRFASGALKTPRPAVFLDRDGVVNREKGFLRSREDFELLPGAARAIRALNQAGLTCVVVTNQPVIARGECSVEELRAIHARMDTLLGNEGAYIDRLYYCPHHPDKGFPGEVPELKIKCHCRKPDTGMMELASRELNIDLSRSWLVGDRTADILAGNRAGTRTILVETGFAGSDGKYEAKADYKVLDLTAASRLIVSHNLSFDCNAK